MDSAASTPGINTDGENSVDELAFSRLLATSPSGDSVDQNGLRNYWNHVNSRSRDHLAGLKTLAPKNDVHSGDKVEIVKIGGNDIELRLKPDGTAEEVKKAEEDGKAKSSEATEKVSAVWARRIGMVPSDEALDNIVIRDSDTYDGKTVMKLLRKERLKSVKSGMGKDELVLGLCLIVLGLAMGVAVSGGLGKIGIML